jgi:hypothetical protein
VMDKPNWFILIDQWKSQKMGQYGVTLPFLVGALAYKNGRTSASVDDIQQLLDDIVNRPVDRYITEVSWCHDISAPVLNLRRLDDVYRMKATASITPLSIGRESIAFSLNLQARWRSKDGYALLARLLEDAKKPIATGAYSRNRKVGMTEYEYGEFQVQELDYIKRSLGKGS